jgi:hypothetical protein
MVGKVVNNEFDRIRKKAVVIYPIIWLDGLRKTTRNLGHERRRLERDSIESDINNIQGCSYFC